MNKSEMAFFFELQKQLPTGYYVFPKMRIADLIDPIEGWKRKARVYKILPKHVDFTICDAYFKPIVAIEVNGESHHRYDRKKRDELVKKIFADAELPLQFVNVGTSFEQSITQIISSLKK